MKKLIIILMVLCCQKVAFGQGWVKYTNDTIRSLETSVTKDSGFLMLDKPSNYGGKKIKILKLDKLGNRQWSYSLDQTFYSFAITETKDGFTAVNKNDSTKRLDILKFSKNGLLDTIIVGDTINIFNFDKVQAVANGDLLLLGSYPYVDLDFITSRAALRKITSEGKILWENNFRQQSYFIQQLKVIDNKYHCLMYLNNISILNEKGELEKSIVAPGYSNNFDIFPNGNYIYNCFHGLFRVDSASFKQIFPNVQNVFLTRKNQLKVIEYNNYQVKYITLLDTLGNLLSRKSIPFPKNSYFNNAIKTPDDGILLILKEYKDGSSIQTLLLIKLDEDGNIYPNQLEGKITKDIDKNCQISSTDKPFKSCIIEAKNSNGETFWGISDSLGRYSLNIDSGNYIIKAYPLQNRDYWQSCTPSVSKAFSSAKKTDSLDFLISPIIDCPAMSVDISTPFLRRCFNNTYTVYYCNKGSLKADNAYVTITLDSLLEFVSASKSIVSKVGRTYRFDVGNMAVDDCGSFNITTKVICGDSTRLGQTLCVEAKIYPDTVCSPATLWSGANMVVTGSCQTDSVLFQIKNTGRAASFNLKSIVIEDEVLFLREPVQLPQNGVFSKKFPANGRTWRMTVEQEPNHPTSTNPTAFVEGCRAASNLPSVRGFATRFPNDDKALNIDVDCQQIQGAFDPMIKQASQRAIKMSILLLKIKILNTSFAFKTRVLIRLLRW